VIYIDTNVIVYSCVNIGKPSQVYSKQLLEKIIREKDLILSPLVLQELAFVLYKLKVKKEKIANIIKFYVKYSKGNINNDLVMTAFDLCFEIGNMKPINDAIHLKIAEKYASRIITFDSDFKRLHRFTEMEIKILEMPRGE
jgi:predicted nucleic acid-binding protein